MVTAVLRHGSAVNEGELDRNGIRVSTETAAWLKAQSLGSRILILTSPLQRAKETAAIIHAALGGTLEERETLALRFDYEEDNRWLDGFMGECETLSEAGQYDLLVCVTHGPSATRILQRLAPRAEKRYLHYACCELVHPGGRSEFFKPS